MLELILLRHAKSDWDADYGSDRDRPLNNRGRQSAQAVGDFLTKSDEVPELVLTSPAVRAQTTFAIAAEAGNWATPHRVVPELYSGGAGDLLAAVRSVSGVERLLVVGHEPTLSATVSRFVGGGSFRVPTAAFVEIRLAYRDWSQISWGSGELRSFTLARALIKAGFGGR